MKCFSNVSHLLNIIYTLFALDGSINERTIFKKQRKGFGSCVKIKVGLKSY